MPEKPKDRFQFTLRTLLLLMVAVVVMVVMVVAVSFGILRSLGFFDSERDCDFQGISYEQLKQRFPDTDIPRGASNIYSKSHNTPGILFHWMRMTVSEDDFGQLFLFRSAAPIFGEKAHVVRSQNVAIPQHWPSPPTEAPRWWKLPKATEATKVAIWERPTGAEYWQYDSSSNTASCYAWYR